MEEFAEDVLAEFACVNTIALTALKAVAVLQPDAKAYLQTILEGGLRAMDTTNYWSVAPERKAAFLEKAKAR